MNVVTPREAMVRDQLRARGVADERVLTAMGRVARERFVSSAQEAHAYDDTPLPIGRGQTISQPYIVALMAEAAQLRPSDRVLEIGTGSGYATAVLAELVGALYTVERLALLGDVARLRLSGPRYAHVLFAIGDGTKGWPEAAAFDAILVAASSAAPPPSLLAQLAPGGRLVIPLGPSPDQQTLYRYTRTAEGAFEATSLGSVRFVPLVGDEGWEAGDRAP